MNQVIPAWDKVCWSYSDDDVEAYHDVGRINGHFGLPLPFRDRVSAIWMTESGLMLRDPKTPPRLSRKGSRVVGGDFGNLVAYRNIKSEHPEAWIWAERYTFTLEPASPSWASAQKAFVSLLGEESLFKIQKRALSLGLDPSGKTKGRPDLAVFIPNGSVPWRFIELKKKGKDRLREDQKSWLGIIAEVLGRESAVEATLVRLPR